MPPWPDASRALPLGSKSGSEKVSFPLYSASTNLLFRKLETGSPASYRVRLSKSCPLNIPLGGSWATLGKEKLPGANPALTHDSVEVGLKEFVMQAFVDFLHQDQPYDSLAGVCDGVRSNQVFERG